MIPPASPGDGDAAAVRRGTQTAGKALALLRHVINSAEGLSLKDLVVLTGQNKSTTHRLLAFLEEEGLLYKAPHSTIYVVGADMFAMGATALRKLSLRETVRPVLEQLSNRTTETVLIYVRSGMSRICIDGIEGQHDIRRAVQIGRIAPIYEATTGAAMVAFLDEADRARILVAAAAHGEDVEARAAAFEEVRAHGYASHFTRSIGAISAPARLPDGRIAGLTISGPADRCSEEAMQRFLPDLLAAAEAVSVGAAQARVGA